MSLLPYRYQYRELYGDGILSNNISKYNVTKYTNNTLTNEFNYRVVPPARAIPMPYVYVYALCNTREFDNELGLNWEVRPLGITLSYATVEYVQVESQSFTWCVICFNYDKFSS